MEPRPTEPFLSPGIEALRQDLSEQLTQVLGTWSKSPETVHFPEGADLAKHQLASEIRTKLGVAEHMVVAIGPKDFRTKQLITSIRSRDRKRAYLVLAYRPDYLEEKLTSEKTDWLEQDLIDLYSEWLATVEKGIQLTQHTLPGERFIPVYPGK